MHVPEVLPLVTRNRDDHGSQFHGHALCFSSTQLRPGHTGPNGWIAYGSRTNPDFCTSFTRLQVLNGSKLRVQIDVLLRGLVCVSNAINAVLRDPYVIRAQIASHAQPLQIV